MPTYSENLAVGIGYLHLPELIFLKEIAGRVQAKNPKVVNIGIGAATSMYAIWEARPDCEMVGVDINPLNGIAQLREGGLAKHTTLLHGDSKEVGKTWTGPIDLLFVDGDHSYAGALGDFQVWCPHLAEGGVVLVHDYSGEVWPQVTQAVDEYFAGWHRVGLVDTLVAYSRFDTYWLEA